MEKRPFEGVKIVQLCWAGVGVFTLNFLSHYGATTVRVETATRPDPVRCFAPFAPTNQEGEPVGLERSSYFSNTHTAATIPKPNNNPYKCKLTGPISSIFGNIPRHCTSPNKKYY